MHTSTRNVLRSLLTASQLVIATEVSAEGVFDFMKNWVSQAQSGIWCGIYGCESASVLAKNFDPRARIYHTCKQALFGGPPSIEVWVCLVEAGSPLSMPGDLDLVALNITGKVAQVTAECKTTYLPGSEFMTKTVGSGGVGFTLGPSKRHDFYIIEAQIDKLSSINWKMAGTADCSWEVQFEEGKKAEKPKDPTPNRGAPAINPTTSTDTCRGKSGVDGACMPARDARPDEGPPPADLQSKSARLPDTACANTGDAKGKCVPPSSIPRKEEKWDEIQVYTGPCRWVTDSYGSRLCVR